MHKTRLCGLFTISLLFTPAQSPAQTAAQPQSRPVLMISIDGMRPEYVTHAGEHGLKLPTLRGFLTGGVYADGVTGVFPTVTYPSHTTLITGTWPAQHGIVNNQRFDPEHNLAGAWYWYADQIKVQTLWGAAHAAGLNTASVGWPVTVNARDIDELIPEYWRGTLGDTANPDDRWLMNAVSRPVDEVASIASRTGVPYMNGNDTTLAGDEVKTRYSLEILRENKPQFMTIHLSSLDEEEHLHGPFSQEANADLEALDGMVGRLASQAQRNDPATVVVVVSDHGFADVDHLVNLSAVFAEKGLIQLAPGVPPTISGWTAQPWALGSMFAIMLHDPADSATREKVRALLQEVAAQPAYGVEAILDPAEVAQRGGVPNAAFVVTLRKGFAAGSSVTGPAVSAIPGHHGTHGFDPQTTPEMRASFFLQGPGIPKGKDLGLIDMRQIAPTLAGLLGVTLPAAEAPALPLN